MLCNDAYNIKASALFFVHFVVQRRFISCLKFQTNRWVTVVILFLFVLKDFIEYLVKTPPLYRCCKKGCGKSDQNLEITILKIYCQIIVLFYQCGEGFQLNDVRRKLANIVIKMARQLGLESSFINSCFIFLSGEDLSEVWPILQVIPWFL